MQTVFICKAWNVESCRRTYDFTPYGDLYEIYDFISVRHVFC